MKLPAPFLIGCMTVFATTTGNADTLRDIYELALENDAQLKALP